MPNEVINMVHQLAAACNKYKGIAFTDKDWNIINDENDDSEGNIEITGVDNDIGIGIAGTDINMENTGVEDDEDMNEDRIGHDDMGKDLNEEANNNMSNYNNPNNDPEIDNINVADDNISIEGELPDDTYITIYDINIVREMNNAQLNNGPETEEERDGEAVNNLQQYFLRPRPTTINPKYSLTQVNNQLSMPKTHAHIMLTQQNVKEGIRQFGERGNAALLKELNQLHERQALMPKKKEDMSYEERKKALRYLMFIKEKHDSTIKARGCADGRSQR